MFIVMQQLANNKINFIEYLNHFKNHYVDRIIWDKGNGAPALAKNILNSAFEDIIIFSKSSNPTRSITSGGTFHGKISNIFRATSQHKNEYADIHKATYPVHLPAFLIEKFTKNNDIVCDPFLGLGTTVIAAEQTGRRCYGLDINPLYIDVTIMRWEKLTGRKAQKI